MNTGTGDAQRLDLTLQMVAVGASGELDRLQAAEKLQASEREFRLLAEAMPQIVWICQPDGMTIYFNDLCRQLDLPQRYSAPDQITPAVPSANL